ncbi:MAG: SDR family oxidoreductase [Bacteroidia bacterium]|nr:SDR family oxidoreductase [Bacteroidia bacterium]MDW8302266.1 SDR family oxidoreductase [Bacteroidia bacterium]
MSKNIVISGITKGIGLAIAQKFLNAHQWNVYGFARQPSMWNYVPEHTTATNVAQNFNKEVEYHYEGAYTSRLCIDAVDAQQTEQVISFAEKLKSLSNTVPYLYQKTDILVNNVGMYRTGSLFDESDAQWQQLWKVNLDAAYYLTKYLYPTFGKGTHIFNICSIASKDIVAEAPSYSITKMALYGLHKAMVKELEPKGIKVTAILPGSVYTDSWKDAPQNVKDEIIPPEDIAALIWDIYHLASQTVVKEIEIRPMNK